MKHLLAFALWLLLTTIAAASSPQEVARRLFPNTVLLVMSDSGGRPLSLGSGFILKAGIVVTNFHVIEGAASGIAKRLGDLSNHRIVGVVAKDSFRDLAILAVDGSMDGGVDLSQRQIPEIGETVYAIGNPGGLEGTFSSGMVSALRELNGLKLLQITAPISPGSSGGPIANEDGEVIGVAVATFKGGQNLNFAIPVDYVAELGRIIGNPVPISNKSNVTVARPFYDKLQGGQLRDAVSVSSFLWNAFSPRATLGTDGEFSLSIMNKLKETIRNPKILVLFYDKTGQPIDYTVLNSNIVLPPGMAKRVTGGVDPSTKHLTTPTSPTNEFGYDDRPTAKLEFRTLNFELDTN
jgi:hypothetical protein